MKGMPVLTIAVPTFNMEGCLAKNLQTYRDRRLFHRLEVLCIDNASEDGSKEIMEAFCRETPEIFRLVDREEDDYGAAINQAISLAKGGYFRIVDADDWVDTGELVKLVDALECCEADVVLTDYQVVNMQDHSAEKIRACERGAVYGQIYTALEAPMRTLPSIHATTYRLSLLRDNHFFVQTGMFFVDEEYVILPYLYVRSVIYYAYDVYRYQVANPRQSTSPGNRAKYCQHRENVLRRLIGAYHAALQSSADQDRLEYFYKRIGLGTGDHFTTLYMYSKDRKKGRALAKEWKTYLLTEAPEFWQFVKRKAYLLYLLNRLHMPLFQYEKGKGYLLHSGILEYFTRRHRKKI